MAVYTPVIRLPPKRKPSLAQSNHSNNSNNSGVTQPYEILDPNDCLVSDTLFLSTLPKNVRESDIRTLLQHCMPMEIIIDQEKDIGQLRFSHPKYADRAYSLYNGFTFTNNTKLELQMYQDGSLDPEATAALLEINGLPEYFDDNKLYDIFRPYGPLNLCKCVKKGSTFKGTAFIQFFNNYSSEDAERNLNGRLLDGNKLSVVPFMPSKSHAAVQQQQQQQQQQKEELSNTTNTEETNPNGTVDIMNLYIKNLEPHITNNDLTQIFRKFGRIISARVMTNPQTGQSKGYGFVSYGKSEEAAAALHEMNGAMLGNRPLTVAYHEPRKGRPTTTTTTTANNNNNNYNNHNDYSNTTQQSYYNNNNNDSHHQQQYHQSHHLNQRSTMNTMNIPSSTPINGLGIDNVDELGINMNLKDLSIGHKPATMHTTATATVNLPQRKASDANLNPLHNNNSNVKLSSPQFSSSPISGTTSTGRSLASLASGLSIQQPPPPLQQHQHHTPVVNIGHNGRPTLRRRGSLESVMTESSANIQRIKLEHAVRNCGDYGKATTDIVDMLLTLKRKERSLCLFNPDFLKEKVDLALEALATCNETDSEDEDDDDHEEDVDGLDMEYSMRNSRIAMTSSNITSTTRKPLSPPLSQPYYPSTQHTNGTTNASSLRSPPVAIPIQSPPLNTMRRESKAIPIVAPPAAAVVTPAATSSSAPLTKENLANNKILTGTSTTTTTTTAANTTSSSSLALAANSSSSANINSEIEALLLSFEGKPIQEKKQLLGDKLFPLVKSTGTRQAPKVTIYLLDTVDLHELAKIMFDTPLLKLRVEEAFSAIQQQQQQ